ncbi:MAG: serine hydrolase domain-containing protein [Chloroflexota bacterium]|nr:serine hydrolase domain-containing protein [Chloroflexota bacterium]
MKIKSLFPVLLVGTVLALTLRPLGKPASAKPASSSASYDEIDAYIEQQMRRLNIPGVSLAIVEGDQIVHLRGFGQARPGGETPSPQTPFVLGSTTKSFTALAVMQLVEAGKIELDAPIQRYLPWFRVADPQASAQMTVRHLLNQTSSLPGVPGMIALADLDDSPGAAERQARALSTLRLTRPVGTAFEYSNLNYNLLGLIVKAASGESYADYVQDHIFDPLEMSHSYSSQTLAKQNGLAVGHRYWFTFPSAMPNLAIPQGSLPTGGLISSAEDMAHYLIAHLNGGRYGDAQILSTEGIAELHRGEAEALEMGISMGQYGMGWYITDSDQTKTVWHSGNLPDFSSYMALLPVQQKGVVILANADHYGFPPILSEVGAGAAALLADQQPARLELGFMPWAMRALLLIPLLQIVGVGATLRRLRRWRQDPQRRPSRGRMWGLHILFPLVPNLLLAAIPVLLLVSGLIRFTLLFTPDFSWIAIICGGFAGIWTFLRSGLVLRSLRKPHRP